MSSTSMMAADGRRWDLVARLGDYVELTKPRIGVMVLVTVAVSAFVGSWGVPDIWLLASTLLGTALIAGSASALNQWLEQDSDALMPRTSSRPLPSGRLSGLEVLAFGWIAFAAGMICLIVSVNAVTAWVGMLTWGLYVWVYTPLKSRTSANTLVGAVAGAMPVVMGWTAVAREPFALDPGAINALTLFLIVFLWQFPQFMAIAWIYRKQYASAGLKMLSVVDPSGRRAGVQAVIAALALLPVSLIPISIRVAGPVYFGLAILLGLGYLGCAVVFCLRRDERSARGLLFTSLVYLPVLVSLFLLFPVI